MKNKLQIIFSLILMALLTGPLLFIEYSSFQNAETSPLNIVFLQKIIKAESNNTELINAVRFSLPDNKLTNSEYVEIMSHSNYKKEASPDIKALQNLLNTLN